MNFLIEMKERLDFRTRVDQYLRREDTYLARALRAVCPFEGEEYRESGDKRFIEVLIATPMAVSTLPVAGALALAVKLEDGGSCFYVQKRVDGDDDEFPVVKIRCMREDADTDIWAALHNATIYGESEDPRNTNLGSFMRQYELEELPQLWQVVQGKLSLIDIRAAAKYVMDYVEENRPNTFHEWKEAYYVNRPGLFSLNSAVNPSRKNDLRRHHYDLLYAKKASLGLDLFILYRTGLKMSEKLLKKISSILK